MDDQHRSPREGDRSPVRDRIKRAVAQGQISAADGDIRLNNVRSAQSTGELEMIVRDLDQLDAAVRPAATAAGPAAPPFPGPVPSRRRSSRGRMAPILIGAFVLLVVGAAGAGVFVAGSSESHSASGSGPDTGALPVTAGAQPDDPATSVPPVDPPGVSPVAPGSSFELSATGIKAFLATYRQKFATSKVVDLTLYDDYVVLQVPVAGKDRHAGWLYRGGAFSDFGGITANFPGSASVDTRRLDIAALMKNIARARRSLKVDQYDTTYVSIDYRPQFDPEPNVNIYVSNKFNESGYLATTLAGSIERAYPYGS